MGKAKRRNFKQGINNRFEYITREAALEAIVNNITNKNEIIDKITLFGFTAEDILEAGADYEDVMALGGLVN